MCGIVKGQKIRDRIMALLKVAVQSLERGSLGQHQIDKLRTAHFLRYGTYPPNCIVVQFVDEDDRHNILSQATVLGRAIYMLEWILLAKREEERV